jgi:hypothetical protein
MGQLSSPQHSVTSLARWFIDHYNNPERPLRSLTAVVSKGTRAFTFSPEPGKRVKVERATMGAISQAVLQWKRCADQHAQNLAIFYFCGHGVISESEQALLAEDYGSVPENALQHAISFREFKLGMQTCAARNQCFFIDACRSQSNALSDARSHAGSPIISPNLSADPINLNTAVFNGTRLGAPAFGRPNKASVFVEALLKSFKGAACKNDDGAWRVTTDSLQGGVNAFVKRELRKYDENRQVVTCELNADDLSLHVLREHPSIPVSVACHPEAANGRATMEVRNGQGMVAQRPSDPEPWEFELPFGEYEFAATFDSGDHGYQDRQERRWTFPPQQRIGLKVT